MCEGCPWPYTTNTSLHFQIVRSHKASTCSTDISSPTAYEHTPLCGCMGINHSGDIWVYTTMRVYGHTPFRWRMGIHHSAGVWGFTTQGAYGYTPLRWCMGIHHSAGVWIYTTLRVYGYSPLRGRIGIHHSGDVWAYTCGCIDIHHSAGVWIYTTLRAYGYIPLRWRRGIHHSGGIWVYTTQVEYGHTPLTGRLLLHNPNSRSGHQLLGTWPRAIQNLCSFNTEQGYFSNRIKGRVEFFYNTWHWWFIYWVEGVSSGKYRKLMSTHLLPYKLRLNF